ncbi:hypothetical protein V2G26_014858 [Clonostachys chloroleuca]
MVGIKQSGSPDMLSVEGTYLANAFQIGLFAPRDYHDTGELRKGADVMEGRRFPLDHHPEGDDKYGDLPYSLDDMNCMVLLLQPAITRRKGRGTP